MKRIIVAVIVGLALSLCVLPMTVLADDEGDSLYVSSGNSTGVVSGNSTGYIPGGSGSSASEEVVPVNNTITKVTAKKTLKYSKLKKKKLTFKIAATVKGGASKSFKKVSVTKKAKKYVSVSKTGKVTVKKGLKKGKYKLKVKITAGATQDYKKTSVTKTIKIVVK